MGTKTYLFTEINSPLRDSEKSKCYSKSHNLTIKGIMLQNNLLCNSNITYHVTAKSHIAPTKATMQQHNNNSCIVTFVVVLWLLPFLDPSGPYSMVWLLLNHGTML